MSEFVALIALVLALLSPTRPLPYMMASCTGRIEAPGKLCQFRVYQDPEQFLAVSVAGVYGPQLWTSFEAPGNPFVWGIDWMTGALPCGDVEIAEVKLLAAGVEELRHIQIVNLRSYCVLVPEVRND